MTGPAMTLRLSSTTSGRPPAAREASDNHQWWAGTSANYGVKAATNERVLFVDDEVFPRPGMLQSHWRLLMRGIQARGLLLWHEDVAITPLIRYIDSRGHSFLRQIKDVNSLDFAYVYTGNFAVLRSAVLQAEDSMKASSSALARIRSWDITYRKLGPNWP